MESLVLCKIYKNLNKKIKVMEVITAKSIFSTQRRNSGMFIIRTSFGSQPEMNGMGSWEHYGYRWDDIELTFNQLPRLLGENKDHSESPSN
jgi:hypothetical protein